MALAFHGKERYTDYSDGYSIYCSRRRGREAMPLREYKKVIQEYCKALSEKLFDEGMIDLPTGLGTVSVVTLTRKAQYRNKKFVGFGKRDYKTGMYDGTMKTFGIAFLPNRKRTHNLRCYGFVANRRLFFRLKKRFESDECSWVPLEFNDEMI